MLPVRWQRISSRNRGKIRLECESLQRGRLSFQTIWLRKIQTLLIINQLDMLSHNMLSPQNSSKASAHKNSSDRFIPKRVNSGIYQLMAREARQPRSQRIQNENRYANLLQEELLKDQPILRSKDQGSSFKKKRKLLKFKMDVQPVALNFNDPPTQPQKEAKPRKICSKPYKSIYAPGLIDDFYLNLVDWSSTNLIGVGLQNSVYVWSGYSSKVNQIHKTESMDNNICAVSFLNSGHQIGFSTNQGQLYIHDINKNAKVCKAVNEHCGRIGSISFSGNMMASGGRDGRVVIHDLRERVCSFRYQGHSQQICGLKWNPEGTMVASGGNDNVLLVWDIKKASQLVKFREHNAAVKAIGWNPNYSGLLASGGGTADKNIRFFSTSSLSQLYAVDTGSQICNLLFSKVSNQLVSTHGYSLNQINVWKGGKNWQPQQFQKQATLTGHQFRVLYLAGSPQGSSIVTGAGDQSLQFWNVFESRSVGSLSLSELDLR